MIYDFHWIHFDEQKTSDQKTVLENYKTIITIDRKSSYFPSKYSQRSKKYLRKEIAYRILFTMRAGIWFPGAFLFVQIPFSGKANSNTTFYFAPNKRNSFFTTTTKYHLKTGNAYLCVDHLT